jgi:hypothetical protein
VSVDTLAYVAGGIVLDTSSPAPEHIDLDSIAIHLSAQRRWRGIGASVSYHSVLMSRAAGSEDEARWALLHDGAEWALGDLVAPIKHSKALAPYRRIEERIEQAITERFELTVSDEIRAAVKKLDLAAGRLESDELVPHASPPSWSASGRRSCPTLSRATAHRLLDRLISSGYIRKEREGRQVRNHLTAEGRRRSSQPWPGLDQERRCTVYAAGALRPPMRPAESPKLLWRHCVNHCTSQHERQHEAARAAPTRMPAERSQSRCEARACSRVDVTTCALMVPSRRGSRGSSSNATATAAHRATIPGKIEHAMVAAAQRHLAGRGHRGHQAPRGTVGRTYQAGPRKGDVATSAWWSAAQAAVSSRTSSRRCLRAAPRGALPLRRGFTVREHPETCRPSY